MSQQTRTGRSVSILFFYPRPSLQNILSSGCPTNILLSIYPLRSTYPSHHKLLYLNNRMILKRVQKLMEINLLEPEFGILILAHPVCKM